MGTANCSTFTTELEQWLRDRPALSGAAVSSYRGEVNRLAEHMASLGVRSVRTMTEAQWEVYLAALMQDRRTIASRRRAALKVTSALQAARITRAFLRYCWKQGWIAWLPGTEQRRCLVPRSAPSAGLPTLIAQLLLVDRARDEETARAVCAMSLAFWGSMKPREIAAMGCNDLQVVPSGSTLATVAGRSAPLVLPPAAVAHVRRYHELRRTSTRQDPTEHAPLLSQLASYEQLSAHRVWLLLKAWPPKPTAGQEVIAVGARLLRDSFVSMATHEAMSELATVRQQTSRGSVLAQAFGPMVPARTESILDRVAHSLQSAAADAGRL